MSLSLRPYSEYKTSGLPWLGKIPAGWSLLKTKYLFTERSVKGFPDEPLLAATQTKGVVPKSLYETRTVVATKDLHLLKLVEKGDYVISLRSFEGGIEVAHYRGIISPAYTVLTPTTFAMPSYFDFLFKSRTFIDSLSLYITGIREGQNIDYERLSRARLPLPPRDEQLAIGQFLRVKISVINKLIRAKRRVIELLNEQKQAIIQRAVTRGLNPSVRLKPSGIEWLGDVPAHWDTNAGKYSLFEIDERSTTGSEELLSVSHITGVSPRSQKNITMFMAASYVGHKLCRPGDLVVNTMWAWMGALGVSSLMGIVSPSYAVYRLRNPDAFVPRFLDRLLRTPPYISEFVCRSTGIRSSRLRLYPERLLRIPLIQPSRTEQEQIVETVEIETGGIAKAIQSAQREIDLIREYRTRLIADIVTGKLDVRGVELAEIDATAVPEGLDEVEQEGIEDSIDADATESSEVEA